MAVRRPASRSIGALVAVSSLLAAAPAPVPVICADATVERGHFYSFWKDGGTGCLAIRGGGAIRVAWSLPPERNLVAGIGWASGLADRVVRYRPSRVTLGSNGYLSLYGWSRDPLVEYYVVDDWGGFEPPGPGAPPVATIASDGGLYRLYHRRRLDQPSIAGRATFDQYWSVRTTRRPRRGVATITFANHVAGWAAAGLPLGRFDYQLLAVEGFGSRGSVDVRLLTAPSPRERAGGL